MYSDKSYVFSFLHASLIAIISACAVGSVFFITLLFPFDIIFPSLSTMIAPNGPPSFFDIPACSFFIFY